MKITLVVATSVDGKITMGNVSGDSWTSTEDKKFFHLMRDRHNLIVMGRGTYDVARPIMKLTSGILRVVLTHHPEKYKSEEVSGQLEFSSEQPLKLVKRLSDEGYKEMLLVSGAEVTTEFFKAGLIDEVYLTLEPWIFGAGKPVVTAEELNIKLQLKSMRKLNKRGTVLLHYKIK